MTQLLSNLRYINLVRCSTDQQVGTSIPAQLSRMNAFATERNLVHVDDVVLPGVTGSVPAIRRDIEELVQRKTTKNDFDVVLIYDLSRFTRSGALHGALMEAQLAQAGVRLVAAADPLPTGRFSRTLKTLKYEADHEAIRTNVEHSWRGRIKARKENRVTPMLRTFYGIDRLYVGDDGTPHHLIQNMPDGTQLKLHPDNRNVLERFEANDKNNGGYRHYRKQKNEKVFFVPGDPAQVAVVNRIFRSYLLDKKSAATIARSLNDEGVISPRGTLWRIETIMHILRNPYYVGRGISDRITKARYMKPGPDHPIPVNPDDDDVLTFQPVKVTLRPRNEWFEQQQEYLTNMLDSDIVPLAEAFIAADLEKDRSQPRKQERHKHDYSRYVLTGLLKSADGETMHGVPSEPKKGGKVYRYYRLLDLSHKPISSRPKAKLLPADAAEDLIIRTVFEHLSDEQLVQSRVSLSVNRVEANRSKSRKGLNELLTKRTRIGYSLERMAEYSDEAKELVDKKLKALQRELTEVNIEIAKKTSVQGLDAPKVTVIARHVADTFAKLKTEWRSLSNSTLRGLLASVVEALTVDTQTLELNLILRLPLDSTFNGKAGLDTLCVSRQPYLCGSAETKHSFGLEIGRFQWKWKETSKSYEASPLSKLTGTRPL